MIFLVYLGSMILSALALLFFKLYVYLLAEIPLLIIAYFWNRSLRRKYDELYPLQDFGKWGKHRTYAEYMDHRHSLGHGRWNAEEYSPEFFRDKK
jgi:hypothetical protein